MFEILSNIPFSVICLLVSDLKAQMLINFCIRKTIILTVVSCGSEIWCLSI